MDNIFRTRALPRINDRKYNDHIPRVPHIAHWYGTSLRNPPWSWIFWSLFRSIDSRDTEEAAFCWYTLTRRTRTWFDQDHTRSRNHRSESGNTECRFDICHSPNKSKNGLERVAPPGSHWAFSGRGCCHRCRQGWKAGECGAGICCSRCGGRICDRCPAEYADVPLNKTGRVSITRIRDRMAYSI